MDERGKLNVISPQEAAPNGMWLVMSEKPRKAV
jgi:hypothetical protein